MGNSSDSWFGNWFDSHYYHLLYQHRNHDEARLFIDNICQYLALPQGARVLDLACGKGRHAMQLASKGYKVVGLDLAPASIQSAIEESQGQIEFYVHDMRRPFRLAYFDAVFNLFTSFGYFNSDREHQNTLTQMYRGLKPGGVVVIDFLNAVKVVQSLVAQETKTVDGIQFQLKRFVRDGYICKQISFEDQGQSFQFEEMVRAFTLSDFESMLQHCGFTIKTVFGNYALEAFQPDSADRLIIVAQK